MVPYDMVPQEKIHLLSPLKSDYFRGQIQSILILPDLVGWAETIRVLQIDGFMLQIDRLILP